MYVLLPARYMIDIFIKSWQRWKVKSPEGLLPKNDFYGSYGGKKKKLKLILLSRTAAPILIKSIQLETNILWVSMPQCYGKIEIFFSKIWGALEGLSLFYP